MNTSPRTDRSTLLRRWGNWALAAVAIVLVVVFFMYAEPGFMVMMADQMWGCF